MTALPNAEGGYRVKTADGVVVLGEHRNIRTNFDWVTS